MKTVPTLPESAPFSPEQRAWLNGFLAGLFYDSAVPSAGAQSVAPAAAPRSLLIGFGSQTGSAQGLAKRLAKEAEKRGFAPKIKELNAIPVADLAKEERVVIVTSTWGDGEPPDNAAEFWLALSSATAPRMEKLEFAILGLGDRNYTDFCGASKKIDERLAALGASRLTDRGECDVDYEAAAKAWIEGLWPTLAGKATASPSAELTASEPASVATGTASYSRTNPFPARLKTNRLLNRAGSAKDTRHFEILLEGAGLDYEVGDALGLVPKNCPVLVEELLATLGFKGEEKVKTAEGVEWTLHEALLTQSVITQPGTSLVKEAASKAGNRDLLALLEPAHKTELEKWLWGRDIVDVLKACPTARFTPDEFIALLRKLQPRLYSISSSPKAHPGEVHLTVAAVRYEAHGRAKKGVASCWLADRVTVGETPVPVFIQTSHGFRLPADTSRPVIMIGPGTGIAPFRAFLEERRAVGGTGKNWLLFGDQCRATDFLYEEQLLGYRADGLLNRLDFAFSRDQKEKIYVQHRLLEHAAELWSWLDAGAHLYVCGDAKRMAKDVDAALQQAIASASGRSASEAAEYVARMKSEKRYQRDVY
ncbi:MAG TPA: sulfite reductase subunit alpha [Candidatus Limnocylindria bacterium]|nr:sulfite reductase subunit alpha [Candidatus Limnocylindria bacterium]